MAPKGSFVGNYYLQWDGSLIREKRCKDFQCMEISFGEKFLCVGAICKLF